MSNIHQFVLGLQIYADQNQYHLPRTGISSTFEISPSSYDLLAENIGSEKTMFCPSLGDPFLRRTSSGSWKSWYGNDFDYIGYNYLGGQTITQWAPIAPATKQWESAQRSIGKISKPIITELNAWSTFYDKTIAPHGKRGAIRSGGDYMNSGLGGITSGQIGAAGGNIGYLDGSGHWKKLDEDKIYRISMVGQDAGWFSTW